ncbi:MAG: SRPBCC family protein [Pseudomonadales bacterium]
MFTVCAEQRLRAPGPRVWEVVQDLGGHHRFNPLIESTIITNDVPVGEGAEREVRLYDGSSMCQRIVDYQPGRSMIIEVIESEHWVRHYVIEISVEPESEDSCVLAYRVSFQMPLGWLGYPLGLIYKPLLRSRYNHMLRGLERYVLTGQPRVLVR